MTGCAQPSAPAAQIDETLVVGTAFALASADPARSFEVTGGILGRAMYDTLLTFSADDGTTPIPMVAESFEGNDSATEYTFKLREDVVFSDGSPLTSADVVFSFNRLKNLKSNGAYLMDGITVSAPDATTVILASDEPNSAIPAIVTIEHFGIMNSKVVKANGGTDAEDAETADTAEGFLNETSAGSGPYILGTFNTDTETVILANMNYWAGEPAYEKIVLKNATSENQLVDIQSGTIDVALELGEDQLAGLGANADINIEKSLLPTIFFLYLNANPEVSEVTSTQAFRDVVKYGLDRDSLLDLAGEGSVQPSGVVPSVFLGSLGAEDGVVRDIEKAKAARATLGDIPTITLEYPSEFSVAGISLGTVAERVQANLKEVGLDVELGPAPMALSVERYREGVAEMGIRLWIPGFPDALDFLVFTPGDVIGTRAGWDATMNPEIVDISNEIAATTDDGERAALFKKFQISLNDVGVVIPLLQPAGVVVSQKDIQGAVYSPAFGIDLTKISPRG